MRASGHIFVSFCPGCRKRITALGEASGRQQMVQHFKKCDVIRPRLIQAQEQAALDDATLTGAKP